MWSEKREESDQTKSIKICVLSAYKLLLIYGEFQDCPLFPLHVWEYINM